MRRLSLLGLALLFGSTTAFLPTAPMGVPARTNTRKCPTDAVLDLCCSFTHSGMIGTTEDREPIITYYMTEFRGYSLLSHGDIIFVMSPHEPTALDMANGYSVLLSQACSRPRLTCPWS